MERAHQDELNGIFFVLIWLLIAEKNESSGYGAKIWGSGVKFGGSGSKMGALGSKSGPLGSRSVHW